MSMNVYLSYKCDNTDKAGMIKDMLTAKGMGVFGFDATIDFYAIKDQGVAATAEWIQFHLDESNMTIVILGLNTFESGWVKQEIQQSLAQGNKIMFINMRDEPEHSELVKNYCAEQAGEAPLYHWQQDQGAVYLHEWVEQLAFTDSIFLNRPELYEYRNNFSSTAL